MNALISGFLVLSCCLFIVHRWRKRTTTASPPGIDWDQLGGSNVVVPNKAKEEWDIREATFLYQTRGLGANPCYLEANCTPQEKVPFSAFSKSQTAAPPSSPSPVAIALPDEFMSRLAAKGGNYRRSSESEATAHGIVDKKTGTVGGYIFTVSDIFWISPTDVEVSGGLSVGTAASSSKTYYLKKIGDGWEVVGEHLKSLSCG